MKEVQLPDEDSPVVVATRDHKMYITLNRPGSLNAHNEAMRRELIAAYDRLDADDDLLVGIIDGAGRAFSAGADLKEQSRQDPVEPFSTSGMPNNHYARLDQVRKPVLACIHGYAVGGGLEVALCCDIRLATEDALLGTPEARTQGGLPGVAVHRLAQVIPKGEALKIMYSSQPISGRRAYEIGLVQELAPDKPSMMAAADRLADEIVECNPASILVIKEVATWLHAQGIAASQQFMTSAGARIPTVRGSRRGADFLADRSKQQVGGG